MRSFTRAVLGGAALLCAAAALAAAQDNDGATAAGADGGSGVMRRYQYQHSFKSPFFLVVSAGGTGRARVRGVCAERNGGERGPWCVRACSCALDCVRACVHVLSGPRREQIYHNYCRRSLERTTLLSA